MSKQTITLGLSQKSVEKAIKQIRQYKQWLRNKTTELVKALAEVGIPVIETNIADASYTFDSKGIRSGSNTEHYTYVRLNNFGSYSQANLVVEGEEIIFIESWCLLQRRSRNKPTSKRIGIWLFNWLIRCRSWCSESVGIL